MSCTQLFSEGYAVQTRARLVAMSVVTPQVQYYVLKRCDSYKGTKSISLSTV